MSTRSEDGSAAVRVDAAGLVPPAEGPQAPAPVPDAEAVSLAELAAAAGARARGASSTTTTRPRTTSTTTRRATTTTRPPAATATTVRPGSAPATTTTTIRPLITLPTLIEKVVPPAAAVSSALTRTDSGVASWFRAEEETCAHRTLPMGTSIKVTRTAYGPSATCKVADRGPTVETGRLIDLSLDTFEKLANRDAGLIDVTIEW